MTRRNELAAAAAALQQRLPQGGRVLCAASGGLDSMCLLHYLDTWGRAHGFSPAAAHFHHGLRPTADRDQAFVQDWCARRGIPCFTGAGDTRALAREAGLSAEEAGRQLRYAFLRQTAREAGFALLLTAHHADDNAETMLLQLVRGTGLRGLGGIPREREGIFRPFLDLTRQELEDYAAAHGIPHVEDETNADPEAAARNLVRLQVMPLLRQLNPRAPEHMAAAAARLGQVEEGLGALIRSHLDRCQVRRGQVSAELAALEEVPGFLLPQVLLGMLDLLGAGRKDVGTAHLAALEKLCKSGRQGAFFRLPRGVIAWVDGGRLVLRFPVPAGDREELVKGRPLSWGRYTLTLLDRREGPGLALRPGAEAVTAAPCPPAGRLTLPGERGGRTVKRLCLDRSIPLLEREGLPALYVGEQLAAVWRLGVDRDFLPEGTACRFVKIEERLEEREQ